MSSQKPDAKAVNLNSRPPAVPSSPPSSPKTANSAAPASPAAQRSRNSGRRTKTVHRPSLGPVAPIARIGARSKPPLNDNSKPQDPRPAPAFREVLAAKAGLTTPLKPDAAMVNKSIPLSLRVSDAEQARIQACASLANLSVSAYLRQCALGVDALRGQVELALGELHQQDIKPAAPPGIAAIPGILGRFATSWFRRLRGHREYTGISLR